VKNRLNLTNSFDRAGNQLKINPYTLTYDAENRQTAATSVSNGSATYGYDGEGRRVTKVNGLTTTSYVYDAMGNLAAEYEAGTPGTSMPCSTCYLFADHLGSTRAVWDSTGVKARYDYLPFGEDIPATTNGRSSLFGVAGLKQKFTSKERDAETGLDYFGARYTSSAQGRFMSPDTPLTFADPENPQSWNLYSYSLNNPLRYTDPDGHDVVPCPSNGPNHSDICFEHTEPAPKVKLTPQPDVQLDSPLFFAVARGAQRASRDISTSAILIGGFATAVASTYAAPALLAAAGSEAGILSLGKGFQLARNASGKIKGSIEDIRAAVYKMSPEQLKQAADELRQSIQVRSQEALKLGEEPAHRLRIDQERDLLRTIEKKLGGN